MSYPPPSGDPISPYEPPAGGPDPTTGPAGLGQPPPGGHPQIEYPQAQYPQAQYPQAQYPPTASFPAYRPEFAAPAAPVPEDPAPQRSNVPLVAVILASALLLCGGSVVAVVLVVRNVVTGAKEAVGGLPTALPSFPTDLPALPTDLPGFPGLPTGGPDTPGRTVQVGYEVDGDGPADITYLLKAGDAPRTVRNAKLPWRLRVSMTGLSLASVVAVRIDTTPGSIHCRTTVDGAAAAERTGDGSLAVAACTKLIVD